MSEPYIGLGLTLVQQVDAFIHVRWMELLRAAPWPGPILNARRQYTLQARNLVVQQFLQRDAEPLPWDPWEPGGLEALLFWDADQLPPVIVRHTDEPEPILFTQHLTRILAEHPEAMVIAGLYFSRQTQIQRDADGRITELPHEPVAYERVADGYQYLSLDRMMTEILPLEGRRKLHRVGGAGTGAMMIRKKVLLELAARKAPRPVFEAPPVESGWQSGRQWTEDLYFCHQVKELLGYDTWLDAANESAHQGDQIWIASQHYLAAHGQIGMTPEAAEHREKTLLWTPPTTPNRAERRRAERLAGAG